MSTELLLTFYFFTTVLYLLGLVFIRIGWIFTFCCFSYQRSTCRNSFLFLSTELLLVGIRFHSCRRSFYLSEFVFIRVDEAFTYFQCLSYHLLSFRHSISFVTAGFFLFIRISCSLSIYFFVVLWLLSCALSSLSLKW